MQHVMDEHGVLLDRAATHLPSHLLRLERITAIYNELIARKVRRGAPLVSYAIDRKWFRKAVEATADDNVETLVCFFCACTHTYREGVAGQHISLIKPYSDNAENSTFFKYSDVDV